MTQLPDRLDRIEALVESNARAIADFRQDLLDTHVQLSQAQTSAWESIAQTNRTVNQVNNSIFQLTQEVSRLRAGQEGQQRVLDYLLKKKKSGNIEANPMTQSPIRFDDMDARLGQLVEATERIATTVERQSQQIERLASAFSEQARAIASLAQTVTKLVDAANRSAQASEAAAVIAQDNQNAIRDLIAELREQRGA